MDADSNNEWCAHPFRPVWPPRSKLVTGYKLKPSVSAHLRREPPTVEAVGDALNDLLGDAFATRVMLLPPGREERVLREDPLVRRMIVAMKLDPAAEKSTEAFLDRLFKDHKKGEVFAHTEAVMALLVALRHAEVPWFPPIAEALSASTIAELSRLRRLAQRLRA